VLLVPLWTQGKAIGSLAAVWEPSHFITDKDEQLLVSVAEHAVLAITNARLFQAQEQALHSVEENEALHRSLLENANDAIATFTLDGTITRVNRWAELLLGWSREELIGQHFRRVVTPASVPVALERTRRWQAGETLPAVFEVELVCKDGRVVPVEARTRVIRDSTGAARGFQGIFRDNSARKQTEAVLLRLSSAVQTSTDSIVNTNTAAVNVRDY
jgi:PAS domain S-box-containing protein